MLRWITGLSLVVLACAVPIRGWLEERPFRAEIQAPEAVSFRAATDTATSFPREPESLSEQTEDAPIASVPIELKRSGTPALSETLNALLVGIDQRPGQKYGGLPDTIVVAVFSEKSGHLGLISVPRDLYVDIPDHGMDRINATFAVAWNRGERSLDLLERVVEDTLKLPIKHKLALNLGGFESLIDALGGVDVDVPCPISDNFLDARTESGRRQLKVGAGLQHLNGVGAGLYVRSRHGRSDWSRSRRQQAVLFAIKRRFETIDGLTRLPEFLEELEPLLRSDMTRADFLSLARKVSGVEPGKIHGLVLGVKQAQPHYTEDGKAVLLPDFPAIDESLSRLFSSGLPGERPKLAPCPEADVALKRTASSKPSTTQELAD